MVIPAPLPCGGVGVLRQETILYNGEDNVYLTISPSTMNKALFTCYASVYTNGQRFLLADDHDVLFMLVLDVDVDSPNLNVKIEPLGETTIAASLVYLDNGVLFVGSRFGDSQLVRLTPQPNAENNSFVRSTNVPAATAASSPSIDIDRGSSFIVLSYSWPYCPIECAYWGDRYIVPSTVAASLGLSL